VVHHHVEFALLFFYRKFLIADQDNNGFAPIFFDRQARAREFQIGGRLGPAAVGLQFAEELWRRRLAFFKRCRQYSSAL
jgi:hypothetical protein